MVCQRYRPLLWVLGLAAMLPASSALAAGRLSEGCDLEFGGEGKGHGKFVHVKDMVFDAQNRLYVLDGAEPGKDGLSGNGLVQKFDDRGRFLDEFSVIDPKLAKKNGPAHLAVDSRGHVFVTVPRANLVQEYDAEGKRVRAITVPKAFAVAVRTLQGKDEVVVLPSVAKTEAGDELTILDADGARHVLKLDRDIHHGLTIKADATGNLYIQAEMRQVYKFNPAGKLLAILGGGTSLNSQDGSELLATVAVDSKGNIYGNTPGNPSLISRFNPAMNTVTQRKGQFNALVGWGSPTILALDRNDRLWAAVPGKDPHKAQQHFRPAIMRLEQDFFDPEDPGVTTHSTAAMGLHLAIEDDLAYDVAYSLAPIPVRLVAKASIRHVRQLDITWVVYGFGKSVAATGRFSMPLTDGEEARHAITFTPPRYGWYAVTFEARSGNDLLMTVGQQIGVTPKFPGMIELHAGEVQGGAEDAPRQAFTGLMLMRSNTNPPLDRLERTIELARKYGVNLLVQFETQKYCTPEHVREMVTRFKGRVKYWEVMNEPNLFMSPEKYVQMLKELYPIIKRIDPEAQVLGPACCGINLGWYEAFFRLGGKQYTDIISMHDYEGNYGITPVHWRWKIGELRKIMARYGDREKPIWQTEVANGALLAHTLDVGIQARGLLLHLDLLETLGIPGEHDYHFYMDEHGFSRCPTYLWSKAGPHAAGLGTRTRYAMIQGRKYAGALDFGPTGNKIFMGLRYTGDDGQTIALRNFGTVDEKIELAVTGGQAVTCVDAFGNVAKLPVRDGKLPLTVGMMPCYLKLEKGQEVTPPCLDFGRNYATQATFRYSAETDGNFDRLNNGIFETVHLGSPHPWPWAGDLPSVPQTLDIEFPYPRTVDHVLLFGPQAGNLFCPLLDYDLQYHDGHEWRTIEKVRTPIPTTNFASFNTGPPCEAMSWYMGQCFHVNAFQPVTTAKLRLVIWRTTFGHMIDEIMLKLAGWMPTTPHVWLSEIEVYGPRPAVEMTLSAEPRVLTQAPKEIPLGVRIVNHSATSIWGILFLETAKGWKVAGGYPTVRIEAGRELSYQARLVPPRGPLEIGSVPVTAVLAVINNAPIQPSAFDSLTLIAPEALLLTPQAPQADQRELTIQVKNVGQAPVEGKLSIRLTSAMDPGKQLTAEAPFGPIEPNTMMPLKIAVPGLELATSGWHVSYAAVYNGLVQTLEDDLLPIRNWQVVGPFPNVQQRGFRKEFAPEKGIDLKAAYALGSGEQLRWQPAQSSMSGYVRLNPLFQRTTAVCAYAVVYVKSPTARKAVIWAGSHNGDKIWLNGSQVFSASRQRKAKPGQDRAEVQLKEGRNEVLLKVPQRQGEWGFYFDLRTPDGRPMTDLIYAPNP